MEKIKEALETYQKENRLQNDTDAYLLAMGEWALSDGPKPSPGDYGLVVAEPGSGFDRAKPCKTCKVVHGSKWDGECRPPRE